MQENEIAGVTALYQRAEVFRGIIPENTKGKTPANKQAFNLLIMDLNPYPMEVIREAIELARKDPAYFSPALVVDKVKAVIESYPEYSPEKQWALVRKQLQGDDFCSLKVLFDNIRTNLAIELMGGQRDLLDRYLEDPKQEPFLRKEFTEKYRNAAIMPGLKWRDWIVYNPDRYKFIRQGTVKLIGCSVEREAPESEIDRLFVNAVNTRQELLTGQSVLAIAQGE